jgi:hypothetical protein
MPEYRIKIGYTTGDSFNSYDKEDYLDLKWSNLDVAKENLRSIKEHYEQYRDITGYRYPKKTTDPLEDNKNKPWFVNVPKLYSKKTNNVISEKSKDKVGEGNWEYRPDSYYAEHCMLLKTDIGTTMQISAFWCGMFESLNYAEIEICNDDMRIEF